MVYDNALCCSVLHCVKCVAVCCIVLQCVAVCDMDGLRHSFLREFLLCVGYLIPQRMAEREDKGGRKGRQNEQKEPKYPKYCRTNFWHVWNWGCVFESGKYTEHQKNSWCWYITWQKFVLSYITTNFAILTQMIARDPTPLFLSVLTWNFWWGARWRDSLKKATILHWILCLCSGWRRCIGCLSS